MGKTIKLYYVEDITSCLYKNSFHSGLAEPHVRALHPITLRGLKRVTSRRLASSQHPTSVSSLEANEIPLCSNFLARNPRVLPIPLGLMPVAKIPPPPTHYPSSFPLTCSTNPRFLRWIMGNTWRLRKFNSQNTCIDSVRIDVLRTALYRTISVSTIFCLSLRKSLFHSENLMGRDLINTRRKWEGDIKIDHLVNRQRVEQVSLPRRYAARTGLNMVMSSRILFFERATSRSSVCSSCCFGRDFYFCLQCVTENFFEHRCVFYQATRVTSYSEVRCIVFHCCPFCLEIWSDVHVWVLHTATFAAVRCEIDPHCCHFSTFSKYRKMLRYAIVATGYALTLQVPQCHVHLHVLSRNTDIWWIMLVCTHHFRSDVRPSLSQVNLGKVKVNFTL